MDFSSSCHFKTWSSLLFKLHILLMVFSSTKAAPLNDLMDLSCIAENRNVIFKPDVSKQCTEFYSIENGLKTTCSCPPSTIFNYIEQKCSHDIFSCSTYIKEYESFILLNEPDTIEVEIEDIISSQLQDGGNFKKIAPTKPSNLLKRIIKHIVVEDLAKSKLRSAKIKRQIKFRSIDGSSYGIKRFPDTSKGESPYNDLNY